MSNGIRNNASFRRAADWSSDRAVEICARQLRDGRLALVLGAGASAGYGLPMWGKLLAKMYADKRAKVPSGIDLATVGELLLSKILHGDEDALTKLVRKHLYPARYAPGLPLMKKFGLLNAISSVIMGRRRGRVRQIINFNVDDVIESSLESFGYDIEVVDEPTAWTSRKDVRIFHPHGYLPFGRETASTARFARVQLEKITEDRRNSWRRVLVDVMSTHTCLFIGLSGDDYLLNMLTSVAQHHLGVRAGHACIGIRFAKARDPLKSVWQERRVAQQTIKNYGEISKFLFRVCHRASEIH